ncbi:MAG: PP2C family protein-serine/threonine phosphatase [Solirubrobacteraceae bacterium]
MASDTGKSLTSARRTRRLAAFAVVACLALGLAFIPSATAKRDRRERPAHVPNATTSPAAASATPESATTAEGSGATPESGATAEGGPSEQQEEATQQAAASPQSSARRKGSGHRRGSGGRGSEHRKGSGRGKEREGATEPTHSREPAEGSEAPSGEGTSGRAASAATLAAAPPATGVALTPAAATTSTAATPPPTAGAAKSGVGGRPTHAVRRPVRPRRSASRRADPVAAATGALPVARSSIATKATRKARRARPGSRGTSAAGRSSPLVTTITRIVDVVPTAVRVLIAGLLALALALAVRSRVAAVRARRLERQRAQLLEDVGLLQAALLPVPPARLGPVGTSAAYQPATGPGAGGDFYDVFALEDGQLAVIVGDVSGHGRQALPHTALVRFTLRAYLEAGLSPRDAVQTAGAVLERQLGGVFATVVAATYQPRERVLTYACAGHPPPVVLGAAADAHAVAPVTVSASPPIGVGMRTGTRQTVVSVPGRSQICFYTDGLTEARVGSELFGTVRLVDTLAELGPQATAAEILARVAERADTRPDDMAACVLSVEGGDDAPAVLVEELELDRGEAASERTERFLDACGVERREAAALIQSVRAAAGRAGTVVLEVRLGDGPPLLTLRRDQLAYLHARRADVRVAL